MNPPPRANSFAEGVKCSKTPDPRQNIATLAPAAPASPKLALPVRATARSQPDPPKEQAVAGSCQAREALFDSFPFVVRPARWIYSKHQP